MPYNIRTILSLSATLLFTSVCCVQLFSEASLGEASNGESTQLSIVSTDDTRVVKNRSARDLNNDNSTLMENIKMCSYKFMPTATVGGHGGSQFDDSSKLSPGEWLHRISIRSGPRVNGIEFDTNRQILKHGGAGGSLRTLNIDRHESIAAVDVCQGNYRSERIFYVKFRTTLGRTLWGGTRTNNCHYFHFAENEHVIGMHGRSGNEIDRLGFVYKLPC